MKMKMRSMLAMLLTLAVLASLFSVGTQAAQTEPELEWSLTEGVLTIDGHGTPAVFTSPDDQPWAEVRSQILHVHIDEDCGLNPENIAYWFAGCTNLLEITLPASVKEIGTKAFYGCSSLEKVILHHKTAPKIVQGAFSLQKPEGSDDPYLHIEVQNEDVLLALYEYDWDKDGCRVSVECRNAGAKLLTAAAPSRGASSYDGIGVCSTCNEECGYTLEYEPWSDDVHCTRHWCSNCGMDQCGGVNSEPHVYDSTGTCTLCGYYDPNHTEPCSHPYTTRERSGCYWEDVCDDCGEVVDSGESHDYEYTSYEYYSGTYHKRIGVCTVCGARTEEINRHNRETRYESVNATQHNRILYCDLCDHQIGTATLENHTITSTGWTSYNETQHRRGQACSKCGYGDYEYADHSFTYGAWENYYDTNQHRRTVTCSVCGYTGYEYADHDLVHGAWQYLSDTQHKKTISCACGYSRTQYAPHAPEVESVTSLSDTQHEKHLKCACGYTKTETEAHTFTTGEWASISDTQHGRTKTCACGYSATEKADHEFIVGEWASVSDTQHERSKTCSCGYSTTEKADHEFTVGEWASISDTQHSRTKSCSCGYATDEKDNHTFTYGAWTPLSDTEHSRTKNCICGYSGTETALHRDTDEDGHCDDCGKQLTQPSQFSVTVPASLSVAVSPTGQISTASDAKISNHSTAPVAVSSVTVNAVNNWKIVPFSTNMAKAKVDSRQIGFSINGSSTKTTGTTESLAMSQPWQIAVNAALPISYDAVVSATSTPVSDQVLTLVFIIGWAV